MPTIEADHAKVQRGVDARRLASAVGSGLPDRHAAAPLCGHIGARSLKVVGALLAKTADPRHGAC